MQLKSKHLKRLSVDHDVQASIAAACSVHRKTVKNWIDGNDIKLCSAASLNAMSKAWGLPVEELYELPAHATHR